MAEQRLDRFPSWQQRGQQLGSLGRLGHKTTSFRCGRLSYGDGIGRVGAPRMRGYCGLARPVAEPLRVITN